MKTLRILRRVLIVLVVMVVVTGLGLWLWARPDRPADFYRSMQPAEAPGTLLAVQPYELDVPAGAEAWLILYSTTRTDDAPAVASAVVMIPNGARGPLKPVAWAHGTTGIVPGCAPSVVGPFDNVPAVAELLAEGWAYIATDYVGLGTEGGHAYLVGDDAARAVLDSIRAAAQMDEAEIGTEAVIWGHSQGGNSALWAGMRAPDYAPEISIVGAAAFAPASDMPALIETAQGGMFGKIVSSYVIEAYSNAYPDVNRDAYVSGPASALARDIAGRCVADARTLFSVFETRILPAAGIFSADPGTGPLGERLRENIPAGPYEMPVFIGQGLTDDLVLPAVQQGFAQQLCDAGVVLDYRDYAGRDHVGVVAADSPLVPDLIAWTTARFEGETPTSTCQGRTEVPT